uniref:F-box domain-containing protein n=1 Tax=Mycena chlorophos TaxID=658473 RepID=A0ABQ0KZK1_MYCCL|nr:predicted protein [Mycena chlorophos]
MDCTTQASRQAVRNRIVEIDIQLAQLELLRSEKATLESMLSEFHYPILTLPREITGEIFSHYLPVYPACPPLGGEGSPTQLAAVCRAWRDIVLGNPALWRAIKFEGTTTTRSLGRQELIRTWLVRSQNMPLSIQFHPPASQRSDESTFNLFFLLLGHSPRWQSISFALLPEWDPDDPVHQQLAFPQWNNMRMPLLVGLELSFAKFEESDPSPALLPASFDAPRLRGIDLRLTWGRGLSQQFKCTSWATLTALRLVGVYPTDASRVLRETKSLACCRLLFRHYVDEFEAPLNSAKLLLPALQSLVISEYDSMGERSEIVSACLSSLVLPRLRILAIHEWYLEDLSGEEDVDVANTATSLGTLLEKWKPNHVNSQQITSKLHRLYITASGLGTNAERRQNHLASAISEEVFFPKVSGNEEWEAPESVWSSRWVVEENE